MQAQCDTSYYSLPAYSWHPFTDQSENEQLGELCANSCLDWDSKLGLWIPSQAC